MITAKTSIFAAVIALTLALAGCNHTRPAHVWRLDNELAKGTVPTDTTMARAASLLFAASGYGEVSDAAVQAYSEMPSIKVHRQAVDSRFSDTKDIAWRLGGIETGFSELLPEAGSHRYFTIISPFNQSVIVSDSTVFIGLNHYLGEQYEPYGFFPAYQRRRKTEERIPLDVAEAIVRTTFPYAPSAQAGNTLLSRMLYEGAVAVAVAGIADSDPDTAIGYTTDEKKWLDENTDAAWRLMVEQKMLYSTDPSLSRNILDLGPASTRLSPDAPGAAGRHIGAAIVKAYADSHPGARLAELIELYKSPSALADSGW